MTTITQSITTLPTAPNPATDTPTTFSTLAAAMVLAIKAMVLELQTWTTQVNTVAGEVNTNASTASSAASAASSSASTASSAASAASSSATAAAGSAATAASYSSSLSGTSATSLAIAVASKAFTATTGRQWDVGQFLTAASAANPANYMHGQVTSYIAGTGALVLNVLDIGGSGTKTDWVITLSAPKGDTGGTGASGKLTRARVTGTTQAATSGNDYLLLNAAATEVTSPTAADLARFKVTPRNRLKTNTINFGSDTYWGPLATGTGVVTMDRAVAMEWEYSSTDGAWVLL